jgi:hypothetical protein
LGASPQFNVRFLSFRGRENYQDGKCLRDVVEMMLDLGGHEENAACRDLCFFSSGLKTSPATNDVIDFIFMMWALQIGCTYRKHIQAGTHEWDAQELVIEFGPLRALLVASINVGE